MLFYRVTCEMDRSDPEFFPDMVSARESVVELRPHLAKAWLLRVDLVDIPNTKANMIQLMNRNIPEMGDPLRTWRLGPRGGLRECEAGE